MYNMNPVTICSHRSYNMEEGGYQVTNLIKKNTTSEEFDKTIASIATYRLENGGRCGWNALGAASDRGNVRLINHIVAIGGRHLLELGNCFGWTPLFCAVNSENPEDGYAAAKELIRLGANVNVATSMGCSDSQQGYTPYAATPLWAAAEKSKNPKLVKLLLRHRALLGDESVSNAAQAILNAARKELGAKNTFLAGYFKAENRESILQTLPYELIREIYERLR